MPDAPAAVTDAPGDQAQQPQPPAPAGTEADTPLGAPGLRALQAERDTVARLTAELAAAKAAAPQPQPPATGGDVAAEVAQLRKDLELERSARALADAGVEHSLSKADLTIVGDFGTPAQIAARAKALKDRLTANGATPPTAPGLPASPNAHRDGGKTTAGGFGSVAEARDEYLAKRKK